MEQTTRWQRSSCSSSSSSFSSTLSSWQPSWQPPQTWRPSQVTYFFEAETELLCPANYALFPFNIHSCEVAVSICICVHLRICLCLCLCCGEVFQLEGGGCEVAFRFCLLNYESKGRYHDIKHWRLAAGRKARMFWCSCLTKLWRTRFLLWTRTYGVVWILLVNVLEGGEEHHRVRLHHDHQLPSLRVNQVIYQTEVLTLYIQKKWPNDQMTKW